MTWFAATVAALSEEYMPIYTSDGFWSTNTTAWRWNAVYILLTGPLIASLQDVLPERHEFAILLTVTGWSMLSTAIGGILAVRRNENAGSQRQPDPYDD